MATDSWHFHNVLASYYNWVIFTGWLCKVRIVFQSFILALADLDMLHSHSWWHQGLRGMLNRVMVLIRRTTYKGLCVRYQSSYRCLCVMRLNCLFTSQNFLYMGSYGADKKIINSSLLAYYYMVTEQVIFPGHYEDDM